MLIVIFSLLDIKRDMITEYFKNQILKKYLHAIFTFLQHQRSILIFTAAFLRCNQEYVCIFMKHFEDKIFSEAKFLSLGVLIVL